MMNSFSPRYRTAHPRNLPSAPSLLATPAVALGLATLLVAVTPAGASHQAIAASLEANSAVELVPVATHRTQIPMEGASGDETGIKCIDIWWADGQWGWYTPEKYEFCSGDLASLVVVTHLSGPTTNFRWADARYFCGTTNPWGYIMTSGLVDFGPLPENEPGYAWVLGTTYQVSATGPAGMDAAVRLVWNGIANCGIPLAGEPDCIHVSPCK